MPVLIGDNRVVTNIYEGPVWQIVKAESVASGEQVWFKILAQRFSDQEKVVKLFHQSAEIAMGLDHKNILKTINFGTEDHTHFILLKAFDGTSLADILKTGKLFNEERARKITLQICRALQYSYLGGIVHGALNLDSIYLDNEDNISIINFGSGALLDHLLFEVQDKAVIPFAPFFSPERLQEASFVNSNTDLYGAGVILYHMLAGKAPFKGNTVQAIQYDQNKLLPSPRIVNPNISTNIERVTLGILSSDVNNNIKNLSTVIRELDPQSALETLDKDEDEPFSESFLQSKIQDLLERLPPVFQVFSPTLVGSRRRVAYALLIVSLIIIIGLAVTVFTEMSSRKSNRIDMLYQDFITEEKIDDDEAFTNLKQNDQIDTSVIVKQEPEPVIEKPKNERPPVIRQEPVKNPPVQTTQEEIKPAQQAVVKSEVKNSAVLVQVFSDSVAIAANVFLDGSNVGTSSGSPFLVGPLASGSRHTISVSKKGFKNWSKSINVSGDTLKIAAHLQPKSDALRRYTFAKVDFAGRLIIDDRLPSYPLPCEVDLAVGRHTLKYIDAQNLFTWETSIVLDMESSSVISYQAEDIGYGELSVVLDNAVMYGYAYVTIDGKSTKRTTPMRIKLPVGTHRIKIFRDGFRAVPSDTVIHIPPDSDKQLVCRLLKN